jgi:GGDEF domain-containing protein
MDGLKRLNDWLGHEAGDAVLRVVANQMSGAATDGLRFYHLSGDEFAARARDPAALAEAMAALQRELDRHPVLLRNADGDELLYDGVGLTFGTGVSYDEADQAANQSKRDRLASGAREEARGDGPPRRLRKADSARVPRGDDGSPQPDREGAGARRVPVTPEPAPPAPAPEPPQNPAPAGFSLSAPQKPAEPAPRFSAQPDLLAPPTAADALRTQQQRTTDRLRFGGAEGAGARGDLFGGVERNQQADLAGGDGAALGTEPVPVPPRETTSPAGPVTPEPAAPAAAPARRSLALIQLEVETTDGQQSVSADVVLKAQRKRIATLDSLLNCIRS